jgi:hypothetical protein
MLVAALAGCSPLKDPAEAAIADANAALAKVGTDGPKYAPNEYQTVSDQVAAMKTAFDKKDYETVLNTVRNVGPNLRVLGEAITDRKRQARIALGEQWTAMSHDVPGELTAVEARVAQLRKGHPLPKGVTADAVAGAGAAVDAAKQGWSEAESSRKAGNVEEAVDKGKAAQAKLGELMASLGMPAPAAPPKK